MTESVNGAGRKGSNVPLMPIERISDWERRLARQDAFWDRAVLDRPVLVAAVGRPNAEFPWPEPKTYATLRDRWMDVEQRTRQAVATVMNTEYLGDALPTAWPDLGPEIFSAFFGCELEYGETTSWSIPNLLDWSQAGQLRFSRDNAYFRKIEEYTDALLEAGKGKFYTGYTDLHPGGDALVAFRDPMNMNLDMLEAVDDVKRLLATVQAAFHEVFDYYCSKLQAAGQALTSWPGIVSSKRWWIPSNDFSCMISKAMFDDVFLPGIAEECRRAEASIYHLDGPQALQHLDSLLAIPELNAIQWVYGEGHGRASDWMEVYRKCQAAGKGLQIGLQADEVDFFIDNLKPEGLWISLSGIRDREEFEAIERKVASWK
mgnify:CR=1 FL=1